MQKNYKQKVLYLPPLEGKFVYELHYIMNDKTYEIYHVHQKLLLAGKLAFYIKLHAQHTYL